MRLPVSPFRSPLSFRLLPLSPALLVLFIFALALGRAVATRSPSPSLARLVDRTALSRLKSEVSRRVDAQFPIPRGHPSRTDDGGGDEGDLRDEPLATIQLAPRITDINKHLNDYLWEGDVIVSETQYKRFSPSVREKRQVLVEDLPGSRWTVGIPYEFHPNISTTARNSIMLAIDFWNNFTCVNWIPRAALPVEKEPRCVLFTSNEAGCYSYIGRVFDQGDGCQVVSIGEGCEYFGITTHELGHALGLYHEQSRYDRATVVDYFPTNVLYQDRYNFIVERNSTASDYNTKYEVGGVMHYAGSEFSSTKRLALATKDPLMQWSMGNLEGPTFVDVQRVIHHYNCIARCPIAFRPACRNGGYVNFRDCTRCSCPYGFGGRLCDEVEPQIPRNLGDRVLPCGKILDATEAIKSYSVELSVSANDADQKYCAFHVKTPPGKWTIIGVSVRNGTCVEGCYADSLEVKAVNDYSLTGYRFCCKMAKPIVITSKKALIPVMLFSRFKLISVAISFRAVNPPPVVTPAPIVRPQATASPLLAAVRLNGGRKKNGNGKKKWVANGPRARRISGRHDSRNRRRGG